jgi:hypothetical protein
MEGVSLTAVVALSVGLSLYPQQSSAASHLLRGTAPADKVSSIKSPNRRDMIKELLRRHRKESVPVGSVISEGKLGGVYVVVSEKLPERLYLVYYNHVVFETLVNTGIPQSPTPDGVFRIYKRERSMTMSGYNPATGMWYNDPGVKYVNFFHYGDAIHAFPRKGYGWPQSLGCVELKLPAAKYLYPRLKNGTPVAIQYNRPKTILLP